MNKITLKRGNEIRDVKESRLQEYLTAGWNTLTVSPTVIKQSDEVIRLKAPVKTVKAAEPPAFDDAIIQGD